MKKLQNKKGFTLIELLVVITIIGILATGATATYTSQIQKARDTTRINDLKSVQSALEQRYGDKAEYPANVSSGTLSTYIARIPQDAKATQPGASGGTLGYAYASGSSNPSGTGVPGQSYELSTGFENLGNVEARAANTADAGNDANRYEIGVFVNQLSSSTGAYIGN